MPPTSRRRPGAQSAKPSASAPESAPQAPSISFEPEKLHALQTQYLQDIQQLWSNGPSAQGNVPDKRFAALTWQENPLSAWAVALYQTNARALSAMADALQADAKTQARVRFAVEQWNAASAPSNFMLFNAEAQKRAVETQGESIAKGMQNLLHDIGKVSEDNPEVPHAILGMKLAEKYKEKPEVCNAIGAHHDEIEMTTMYAPIIQVCDAISGARPGARREVAEQYMKRLKDLEALALSYNGVEKTYAIQAGREVRVLVSAEKVDDKQSEQLAFDISQKIQTEMTYPGQVKVTVIREVRSTAYAK